MLSVRNLRVWSVETEGNGFVVIRQELPQLGGADEQVTDEADLGGAETGLGVSRQVVGVKRQIPDLVRHEVERRSGFVRYISKPRQKECLTSIGVTGLPRLTRKSFLYIAIIATTFL